VTGHPRVVLVQIYGITDVDDAAAVAALGPDHVGVVLDEGLDAWDAVDGPTARRIVAELRPAVRVVGLSLRDTVDGVIRTVERLAPDIVHVARAVGGLGPDGVEAIRDRISPLPLMVTVPVRDESAVAHAQELEPTSDFLLLDSAHPDTGVVGATGLVHDWDLSARVVAAVDTPVFLAGGLGPDNVGEAIARVRPAGVDSETRTSRDDDRRRKDLDRVRRFIETARA